MIRVILPLALVVNAAVAITVTVCSEPTPSSGSLFGLVEPSAGDPPTIDYSLYTSIFLISPDGASMWDKTCGYPYHYSCATDADHPSVMLTTMPGITGYGFRLTPSAGDNGAVITINDWASHPLDEVNGRWVQVFVIPIATLNADPYLLFAHGEGVQIATTVTDLYPHSVIFDRNGPQDPRCAAFYPPPPPIEVPILPVPTLPLTNFSDSNSPTLAPIFITVTSTVTVTETVTASPTPLSSPSPPPTNAILNGQSSGATSTRPGPFFIAIAAVSAIYFLFA